MLRLKFCFLQGYFNNVSEYLRIGPPLYFVVKNYNYRYHSGYYIPFLLQFDHLCSYVVILLIILVVLYLYKKRERTKCQLPRRMPPVYFIQFNLQKFNYWCLMKPFLLLLIFQPEFLPPCVCERRGRGGLKGEPWFISMYVTLLRLQYWYWSNTQLRIKTYKPVMLH